MRKLAGLVLGVVMILGAAAGIVKVKQGPVSEIPTTCPIEICPGSN